MADAPYLIERVTATDLEDVNAVAAAELESFTNPWTREMLLQELSTSRAARLYVLRLPGERVAAFCSCWVIVDELHINTMAVRPGHRRRGLASALLRAVMADAATSGATRVTLEVRRSNEPALKLYESLGFAVTACRPGYYSRPDEDALILWKLEADKDGQNEGAPEADNPRSP